MFKNEQVWVLTLYFPAFELTKKNGCPTDNQVAISGCPSKLFVVRTLNTRILRWVFATNLFCRTTASIFLVVRRHFWLSHSNGQPKFRTLVLSLHLPDFNGWCHQTVILFSTRSQHFLLLLHTLRCFIFLSCVRKDSSRMATYCYHDLTGSMFRFGLPLDDARSFFQQCPATLMARCFLIQS